MWHAYLARSGDYLWSNAAQAPTPVRSKKSTVQDRAAKNSPHQPLSHDGMVNSPFVFPNTSTPMFGGQPNVYDPTVVYEPREPEAQFNKPFGGLPQDPTTNNQSSIEGPTIGIPYTPPALP